METIRIVRLPNLNEDGDLIIRVDRIVAVVDLGDKTRIILDRAQNVYTSLSAIAVINRMNDL